MPESRYMAPKALVRDRLLARLAAWSGKKLVIIHAPAGQGKSTLAATYAASLDHPVAWYALDAGDDCPDVVLRSLGQALQAALPGAVPHMPRPPRDRYGDDASKPVLRRWFGEVFGSIGRLLLVIDDFHLATTSPALRALFKTLIETTPSPVRILLLSRNRPALEVAKLRARQDVAELTGEDLSFNDEEVQALFGTVFGVPLAPAEAAAINRTAEGWPAGLVLLNGYFSSLPDPDRRTQLSGIAGQETKKHIFEYLAQEVFASLPRDLQEFLLRTAVADTLPMALLSALTGLPEHAPAESPSVAAMVRELTARNLFISTFSDGTSVRYHALFREFLQKLSRERFPAAERRRQSLAAAACFRSAGDPVRSIDLLLAAGAAQKALKQIESCGQDLIAQGRSRTLLRWIDALPPDLAARPWPRYLLAHAHRYRDARTALGHYERAFRDFRSGRDSAGQMLALSGIIESSFHAGGDFRRMAKAAKTAERLLGDGQRGPADARARLLLAVGIARFFQGRLRPAADALRTALDLFRRQKNPFFQITCAVYLTPCALYQGDFAQAREAVKLGFAASDTIPEEVGGRAALFLTQAMTELFEGNFEEADRCIERCRTLADDHALASIGFLSLDIGGWIKIARGDLAGAVKLLEACWRNSADARYPFFQASSSHLLAIAWLFQGKLDRALAASDRALAVQKRAGSRLFQGIYLIASGAIKLKLGKRSAAEKDLLEALRLLRQCGAAQQEANARLLLARLSLLKGREQEARWHLAEGFGIGAERGIRYFALQEGSELAALAAEAAHFGIEPLYCGQLAAGQAGRQEEPFLRIYCLGEFRVFRQGVAIADGEWKSRLAKTLVKLLAMRGHQKLSRDEAAEILWPDMDADQHVQLLNSLLHRTRKALEPGRPAARGDSCILQEGGMLRLNARTVWVDIDAFSDLHTRSRRQRSARSQDAGGTLALYDQAFELYRGDFLPGDLYHDWSSGLRDRLKRMHHDMLKHAADLTDAPGTRDTAATYYDKMFSLDPCNEKACRWLMTDRMASGLRSEAIRLYERCQLALRKELDIEPEEQTRRLYRSIIGD